MKQYRNKPIEKHEKKAKKQEKAEGFKKKLNKNEMLL